MVKCTNQLQLGHTESDSLTLDSTMVCGFIPLVKSPAVVHFACLIDLALMFKNTEQNLTTQRHLSQVHDETRPNIAWC
jgi:hypothetical protein